MNLLITEPVINKFCYTGLVEWTKYNKTCHYRSHKKYHFRQVSVQAGSPLEWVIKIVRYRWVLFMQVLLY